MTLYYTFVEKETELLVSMVGGEEKACSEVDKSLDGLQAAPLVGQVERLKDVGEGCVVAAHPLYRRLQVQEALTLNGGSHLGGEAHGQGGFMGNQHSARLRRRLENSVFIPR